MAGPTVSNTIKSTLVTRRRERPRRLAPFFEPVCSPARRRQNHDETDSDRKSEANRPGKSGGRRSRAGTSLAATPIAKSNMRRHRSGETPPRKEEVRQRRQGPRCHSSTTRRGKIQSQNHSHAQEQQKSANGINHVK